MLLNIEKILEAITKNEIGARKDKIAYFSNADGTSSRQSGYSFGRSQFDVSKNLAARNFLREKCNFTRMDIERLRAEDPHITDLQVKIAQYKAKIDAFDIQHIKESMERVLNLEGLPQLENTVAFVQLVDYHNQFYISRDGKMHTWLKEQNGIITSQDILEFKLGNLKWAETARGRNDINRRWSNIEAMGNFELGILVSKNIFKKGA